ncbi:MAG: WG repeat-containing protein [Paludibacteraceae bacterium]|nr:WG repeat-containing protein [Paludibacteraceae bacterium]
MKNVYFKFLLIMFFSASLISCTTNSVQQSTNLYRILVGEKYGFINSNGQIIIEPQYDYAYDYFSDGVCYVKIGEKNYLIDEDGNFIKEIPDSVENVFEFTDGLAKFKTDYLRGSYLFTFYRYGIISKEGEVIIPAANSNVSVNKDEGNTYIIVAEDEDEWYMIDKTGNMIGEKCDSIWRGFSNGLCGVKKGGKWGFMNTSGTMVIKPEYDWVRSFSEEKIARVCKDGLHMFIDQEGNCVYSAERALTGMRNNRAIVIINGKKCLINKSGKTICTLDYDECYDREDRTFIIKKGGNASIIDSMGNVILSTTFDWIYDVCDSVALVGKGDEIGLICLNGKEIVPLKKANGSMLNTGDNIYKFSYWKKYYGYITEYYNSKGILIWQDLPTKKVKRPYCGSRADFIEYYDANISRLDPIEGIYYVKHNDYYQDRDNLNYIGLNNSNSNFFAVARVKDGENEFGAYFIGTDEQWANKFVKIGNSQKYAIVKTREDVDYSSEGMVELEDPNSFSFRLETGRNNWYNFFVTYEFTRDYPSSSDCEQYQNPEWTGSGFAVADGYIVTNYHVTNGAKSIRIKGVKGDLEKSFKGVAIASDKEHDLSLIKIMDSSFDGLGDIPYTISHTDAEVGENIFVLGYPLTTTMGNEVKLTEGIINSSTGFKGDNSMYQISAAIQPGNSGGPLFNADGNVIGVVRAKHKDVENVNYAVKSSYLLDLLNTSGYDIEIANKNKLHNKKLSTQVKTIKNFVYIIECSSK